MTKKLGGGGGRKAGGKVTRLPAGTRTVSSAPERQVGPDDNLTDEQKRERQEQAESAQLMSILARLREAKAKTAETKAPYDAAKAAETDIFRAAKAIPGGGFQRQELEELLKDSAAGSRKDVSRQEERRVRFRGYLGLPVGRSEEQRQLDERLPEVEKNAAHWRAAGYTAGVTAGDSEPPIECVKAGFVADFSTGYSDGQKINGLAMIEASKKPEPPKPEETEVERRAREKREEEAVKNGLATMTGGEGDDTVQGGEGDDASTTPAPVGGNPDDQVLPTDAKAVGAQAAADFEADEAELAAQKTRQAVQAAKAPADEEAPAPEPEAI